MKASTAVKAVLITLIASGLAAILNATPTSTPAPVPSGVFYLPNQRTISLTALTNADIDGVVVGGDGSDLEPTPGHVVLKQVALVWSLAQLGPFVEPHNPK